MTENSKTPSKTEFNYSENKWQLYKPLSATRNGVQSDELKDALVQMFILEPSSGKCLEMAQAIMAVGPDPADKYSVRAGKSNGLIVEVPVTGAQLIRRCQAVIELANAGISPVVIREGEGKSSAPKTKQSKVAGFAKKSPVPAPAKK